MPGDSLSDGIQNKVITYNSVGDPRFGMQGAARLEWYHALALCFTKWVRIPEAPTPAPPHILKDSSSLDSNLSGILNAVNLNGNWTRHMYYNSLIFHHSDHLETLIYR